MDVDPLVLGHAQGAGETSAGDDDRGGLVHLIARHGHARIGFGDDAIAVGNGGEFLSRALHRSRRMRVRRRHQREGRKQLADFEPVFLKAHAQLMPPRVLRQRIKRDRPARAVHEQHRLHQFLDPEALILKVAADGFRPIRDLALRGQREHGRDCLAANDHRALALPRRDGLREFAHQLLVGLPAGGGQDRAHRVRANSLGDCTRDIIRRPERRLSSGRDISKARIAARVSMASATDPEAPLSAIAAASALPPKSI